MPPQVLVIPACWGHWVCSAAELKTIQEETTLNGFARCSVRVLKEPLGWNHAGGVGPDRTGRLVYLPVQSRSRRQDTRPAACG